MNTRVAAALAILFLSTAVMAQDPGQIQRLFESGKYQQVVDSTTPDSPPDVLYTTAQSQQKLGANDQAAQTFSRLAERPEADPWHFIGLSGRQLVEGNADAAIASARQGVAMAPDLPYSHFQLGLALARQQAWPEAAAEFDAASERQPSNAYAHYYGGYRGNVARSSCARKGSFFPSSLGQSRPGGRSGT